MSVTTLKILTSRSVAEAAMGGTLVDVEQADVERALAHLKSIYPSGAAIIENPLNSALPRMPNPIPPSMRLSRVWYECSFVGVVIDSFSNGGKAQQDGIVSQG